MVGTNNPYDGAIDVRPVDVAMPPPLSRSPALSLAPAELWTLHHVLRDRIEAKGRAADAPTVDPLALAIDTAFETLEAGADRFPIAELAAIREVITDWWAAECDCLEAVLRTITQTLSYEHAWHRQHDQCVPSRSSNNPTRDARHVPCRRSGEPRGGSD